MKIVSRDFVGGYYLTALTDPGLLRGVRYVHSYPCGTVGDKSFTYIRFSPSEFPDTKGDNQEMFDMSGIGADSSLDELSALLTSEELDLSKFAPSAVERITTSMSEGMDLFDACTTHIARLIPEYCGESFEECISHNPSLLVPIEQTDQETGVTTTSYNIWRCSLE